MKATRISQAPPPPPDLIVLEMTVEEAQQLRDSLFQLPIEYWKGDVESVYRAIAKVLVV